MIRKLMLVGLMAVAGVLVAPHAASAQTYGTECVVALDSTTVSPGQVVTITGTVLGGTSVTILIDGQVVAQVEVQYANKSAGAKAPGDGDIDPDDPGTFSTTITVPDLGPGTYTLTADCGGSEDSVMFQVIGQGGPTDPGGPGGPSGPGSLSDTGSNLDALARVGGGLLLLGGILMLIATKRRRRDRLEAA